MYISLTAHANGFWLIVADEELFVPFERYPELRNATVEQISNCEQDGDDLRWPDLDVDISLDALRHPERFPLVFKRRQTR